MQLKSQKGSYHGNKNTEIPSMNVPLNTACRNHYVDSRGILMVMIPEIDDTGYML